MKKWSVSGMSYDAGGKLWAFQDFKSLEEVNWTSQEEREGFQEEAAPESRVVSWMAWVKVSGWFLGKG